MTAPDPHRWPTLAPLGPVERLRLLAAALPGVVLAERVVAAPMHDLWAFIADLERSVPAFDPMVGRLRVVERDEGGGPVRVVASPGRISFRVQLGHGWCLMQSRWYLVGMAAEPAGDRATRYAHMEGFPQPPSRWARVATRPLLGLGKVVHRRSVGRDLDGIEQLMR